MFADIKGSTEVVSGVDPERASEWLEQIIEVMRSAVHHHGGTVNRVQGDGIMALFGAPIEYDDHAMRACAAAIEIMQSINVALEKARPRPNIRIGIASGEVLTLPVVADPGPNYDAMGHVVHLAARLEQCSTPGIPLISMETWRSVDRAFETRRLELKGLRGLSQIVPAFEILRWKRRRNIATIGSKHPQGIFVGREGAMATLRDALARTSANSSRVVFITGEPGIGKSRLISEFISGTRVDARHVVSHASPYKTFSYGPLAGLVADLAGVDPEDDPEQRKMLLTKTLSQAPTRAIDIAALETLLDVSSASSEIASLSPIDRRQRLESEAAALFACIGERIPLVLICEDIHWLDEDGARQVARLCNAIRSSRCLVIFTARDAWEAPHELQTTIDDRCDLKPLAPADARVMLDALIRPGRGTVALMREVIDRTQGNPLFIEESLNVLHQMAALAKDGNVYSLKQPGIDIPLSPTVRGVLAARIDRLGDLQKDILQAIAVIGDAATITLLCELLGFEPRIVMQATEHLIELGLLGASAKDPQTLTAAMMFRHPLIKEVTYEQMPMRERIRIHEWMLRALEKEKYGLHDRIGMLAEHAFRAEAWDKAAIYMLRAGNSAFWRDAKTEAVRYLARGLEATKNSTSEGSAALAALKLRLELRNPLFQLARMGELDDHLRAARPLALKNIDPIQSGRYHIYQSHYDWFTGNSHNALMEADAAQRLAVESNLPALLHRAQFQRGLVFFSRGMHWRAIDTMKEVGSAITGHDTQNSFGLNKSLLATTLAYSARAHADLGALVEARRDAARSLAIAHELDNQFEWVFAYLAEGWVLIRANEPGRAVPILEKAYATCQSEDVPLMGPVAASFLSTALLDSLVHKAVVDTPLKKRALQLADEAVKQGDEFQFLAFQPWRKAVLGRALLAVGNKETALNALVSARDMACRQLEPLAEIDALIWLAHAQYSLGGEWEPGLIEAEMLAERLQLAGAIIRCRSSRERLSGL